MKTVIIGFLIAVLFCTLSYSQNTFTLADRTVDFEFVEQNKELKHAFTGEFEPFRSNTDKPESGKMKPGGKGALIGVAISAPIGALVGTSLAVTVEGTNQFFGGLLGQEPEPSNKGGIVAVTTLIFSAVGGAVGAVIGHAARDKSGIDQLDYPQPVNYGPANLGLTYYSTEPDFEIINVKHKF